MSYSLVKAGKKSTLVLSCDAQAKRLYANPVQLVRRRSELSPEHSLTKKVQRTTQMYFNVLYLL